MSRSRSITIAGIPGSLRLESFNRRLLQAAAHMLPAGIEMKIWEGLARIPPFSEDAEAGPVPPAVAGLRKLISDADALLIATPEYNGSMPGQLKNALDWASRPRGSAVFDGKPVGTASASPTPYGAVWAQDSLRKVLSIIGADVTGGEFAVPYAFRQFDQAGRLADAELRGRLIGLITELAERSDATPTVAVSATT
jgi:chromate reductase